MNRRELLQTLSVSVVFPHNSATQQDRETEEAEETVEEEERQLTFRRKDDQTGRIVERYEITWRGHTRAQWRIETPDGELLFREEYLLKKMTEHYYGDTFLFRIYESSRLEDIVGATMFSPRNEFAYHKHVTDDAVVTYRENIDTGEHERIQ